MMQATTTYVPAIPCDTSSDMSNYTLMLGTVHLNPSFEFADNSNEKRTVAASPFYSNASAESYDIVAVPCRQNTLKGNDQCGFIIGRHKDHVLRAQKHYDGCFTKVNLEFFNNLTLSDCHTLKIIRADQWMQFQDTSLNLAMFQMFEGWHYIIKSKQPQQNAAIVTTFAQLMPTANVLPPSDPPALGDARAKKRRKRLVTNVPDGADSSQKKKHSSKKTTAATVSF